MMRLLLKYLLIVTALSLITSCGGGSSTSSGAPYIYAELISFPAGSTPLNFQSASVYVIDDSSGESITNATVTINGVTLTYDATQLGYQGNPIVMQGASVTLAVTVGWTTYIATGSQFSAYPTISVPAAGSTWQASISNAITWSGGTPDANAYYGVGVLDAGPEGQLIWPSDGYLQTVQLGTNSYSIPAGSLSVGSRLVIAGMAVDFAIPNAADGSILVLSGFNSVPITVADDPGFHWTDRTNGAKPLLNSVAWSGSQFVAVGDESIFYIPGGWYGAYSIFTSPDGSIWTEQTTTTGTPRDLRGVASSGSQLVAVGTHSILTSGDGQEWAEQSLSTPAILYSVVWSGSQFVAVGVSYMTVGAVQTSPDGITWTSQTLPAAVQLDSITWSGTQYVAVGYYGVIFTSPDGITWTSRSSPTTYELHGVAWSGSQFVAVGEGGVIITSPDGITWTQQDSGTTDTLFSISSSEKHLVATGWYGDILVSSDGISWLKLPSQTYYSLNGITWSGNTFVIVGSGSIIFTSP